MPDRLAFIPSSAWCPSTAPCLIDAILYEPRIPSSRSAFVNCAGEQLLLIALARALL
jgi:hypothetical protein